MATSLFPNITIDIILDAELDIAKFLNCYPDFDGKSFIEFIILFQKVQKMKENNKTSRDGENNMLNGLLGVG